MKTEHVQPLAAAIVWVAAALVAAGPGNLFTVSTTGLVKGKLECNAVSGVLTLRGKTTRGGCWALLSGQFDAYSAFYVSEDLEDYVFLGNTAALVVVAFLGVAAALVALNLFHHDDRRLHEAGLATAVAAGASVLALFEFSAAVGESTAATRYGYAQTPSMAAAPLLPLFPLLMLVVVYHWHRLSQLAAVPAAIVAYKPGNSQKA